MLLPQCPAVDAKQTNAPGVLLMLVSEGTQDSTERNDKIYYGELRFSNNDSVKHDICQSVNL